MSALQNWEIENAVKLVDTNRDALYRYDADEIKKITEAKPWRADPNHFKQVQISANALIKMTMHAREGGSIEVMGLMLGHVKNETFIVTDAMRLPVEGTETRVNAGAEADEYMVEFLASARAAGRFENPVGWYHSHPGYGCWLSGIDVATQASYQMLDPFVAVVIDPDRTISSGKVEIGAFRTYPDGYKPEGGSSTGGGATIPEDKAQDFGAHADRYYSLEVSHFKSALDSRLLEALWNKYWVQTISASPLSANRDYGTRQINDIAVKLNRLQLAARQRSGMGPAPLSRRKAGNDAAQKVVLSAQRIANEEKMGLMAAMVKKRLFTCTHHHAPAPVAASLDLQMADAKAA